MKRGKMVAVLPYLEVERVERGWGIGVGTSTNGVICRHGYYRVAIEQLDAARIGRGEGSLHDVI